MTATPDAGYELVDMIPYYSDVPYGYTLNSDGTLTIKAWIQMLSLNGSNSTVEGLDEGFTYHVGDTAPKPTQVKVAGYETPLVEGTDYVVRYVNSKSYSMFTSYTGLMTGLSTAQPGESWYVVLAPTVKYENSYGYAKGSCYKAIKISIAAAESDTDDGDNPGTDNPGTSDNPGTGDNSGSNADAGANSGNDSDSGSDANDHAGANAGNNADDDADAGANANAGSDTEANTGADASTGNVPAANNNVAPQRSFAARAFTRPTVRASAPAAPVSGRAVATAGAADDSADDATDAADDGTDDTDSASDASDETLSDESASDDATDETGSVADASSDAATDGKTAEGSSPAGVVAPVVALAAVALGIYFVIRRHIHAE